MSKMPSVVAYNLPFLSAGVGPVHETDDPNLFMQYIENLMALGGGDEPEMCFSAIQVN